MSFDAKIIADSLHPNGSRLTSFQLKYPRMIHAELMTHRVLSRNASSSRAIPVAKFIAWVKDDPAMPVAWLQNVPGMQGGDSLSPEAMAEAEKAWLGARDAMIPFVERLVALNVHKQIANRLLEPWHHISVIASSTNWANFLSLRYHKQAQPEIRELAKHMLRAFEKSRPTTMAYGDWHLPYVKGDEAHHGMKTLVKYSVARCARVSYNNHDGTKPDAAKDIELHDRLMVQVPLHASPAEHQAQATREDPMVMRNGNFAKGWIQHRKTFPNECIQTMPELEPQDREQAAKA